MENFLIKKDNEIMVLNENEINNLKNIEIIKVIDDEFLEVVKQGDILKKETLDKLIEIESLDLYIEYFLDTLTYFYKGNDNQVTETLFKQKIFTIISNYFKNTENQVEGI